MAEVVEPGREHVVEGYSEKRKFDGVVPRRQGLRDQAKDSNPGVKCHEELYIAKIPERS